MFVPLLALVAAAQPACAQGQPDELLDPRELERQLDELRALDERFQRLRAQVHHAEGELFEAQARLDALHARAETDQPPQGPELESALLSAQRASVAYEELIGEGSEYTQLEAESVEVFGRLLRQVDASLEVDPSDVSLRLTRAELLVTKNQFGLARADLEAAIVVVPTDPRALGLLATCLLAENRFVEALGLYQMALDGDPSDARRAQVALTLYCLNRFAEARAARDAIEDHVGLPARLAVRCEWWLTDEVLDGMAAAWDREQMLRAEGGPRVVLDTTRGRIVVELFTDAAPRSSAAFLELVAAGYYDGLSWHRVVPNLLVQTGDPATRAGGATAPGEAPRIPFEGADPAARRHFRGSLSLFHRPQGEASEGFAGAELFLTVIPAPLLDGRHTVFGHVVEGMRVVERLGPDDRVERAFRQD
jgi:peptidyl-prolyl cis-trans isomerase-like 1